MKTTMKEAVTIYSALDKLSKLESKYPFRLTYWITKNIHALSPTIEAFQKERDLIYKDCTAPDENGSIVKQIDENTYEFNVRPEKREEWVQRFNELDSFDVEFDPYLLDLDALMESNPDFEIEPQLMTSLMPLIKF